MEKRGRERKAASIAKQVATVAAELTPVGASWRQGRRRDLEWHPLPGEVAQGLMHPVPSVMVKGSLVAFHSPAFAPARPGRAGSEARESLGKEHAGS